MAGKDLRELGRQWPKKWAHIHLKSSEELVREELADRALRANQQNKVDSASTAESVKAGLGNTRAKTNLQRKVDPAVMADSVKPNWVIRVKLSQTHTPSPPKSFLVKIDIL
jgi:hypothetical protein